MLHTHTLDDMMVCEISVKTDPSKSRVKGGEVLKSLFFFFSFRLMVRMAFTEILTFVQIPVAIGGGKVFGIFQTCPQS